MELQQLVIQVAKWRVRDDECGDGGDHKHDA